MAASIDGLAAKIEKGLNPLGTVGTILGAIGGGTGGLLGGLGSIVGNVAGGFLSGIASLFGGGGSKTEDLIEHNTRYGSLYTATLVDNSNKWWPKMEETRDAVWAVHKDLWGELINGVEPLLKDIFEGIIAMPSAFAKSLSPTGSNAFQFQFFLDGRDITSSVIAQLQNAAPVS